MAERPSWLPENWLFEAVIRTSGATVGIVDKYYYEPISGKRFRSKKEVLNFLETDGKRKKESTENSSDADATPSETPKIKKKKSVSKIEKVSTLFYFDAANPPERVCWTMTDSYANTWEPSIDGNAISDIEQQEWKDVFTSLSKLTIGNTKKEMLDFLETDGKRKKESTENSSDADATPYETPKIKKQKSESKTEKVNTLFYFDAANPPERVCWTMTNSYANTWEPSIDGNAISDIEQQEWKDVFTSLSKLTIGNTKKEVLDFLETDGKRKKESTENSSDADATPFETPKIKKQKSESKTEKVNTLFYFDAANPSDHVCWTMTDSYANTWEPSIDGNAIFDIEQQEWKDIFTSVSKLKIGNTKKET